MRTYFAFGIAMLAAAMATPAVFGQVTAQSGSHSATVIGPAHAPYLGIGVQDVNVDRAKTLKLKDVRGAEVTSVVADSPAAKAGFKEGDVVLDYNGQSVEGGEQLSRLVRETPIGRQVKIGVWRAGASMSLSPTVETSRAMVLSGNGSWMPNIEIPMRTFNMPDIEIPRLQPMYQSPMLGIEGESLGQEEQLAEFFGVKDGVLVKAVTPNSAADKAGLKAGDVIVKIDDSRVTSSREITSVLRSMHGKTSINVIVVRSKKEVTLPVTLDAAMIGAPVRARAMLLRPAMREMIEMSMPMGRARIVSRNRVI